jgi:hypothetical protein
MISRVKVKKIKHHIVKDIYIMYFLHIDQITHFCVLVFL